MGLFRRCTRKLGKREPSGQDDDGAAAGRSQLSTQQLFMGRGLAPCIEDEVHLGLGYVVVERK